MFSNALSPLSLLDVIESSRWRHILPLLDWLCGWCRGRSVIVIFSLPLERFLQNLNWSIFWSTKNLRTLESTEWNSFEWETGKPWSSTIYSRVWSKVLEFSVVFLLFVLVLQVSFLFLNEKKSSFQKKTNCICLQATVGFRCLHRIRTKRKSGWC